ncbi:Plasma membrane t-SNARE, secretory vesicle fusion [Globomyces sp. JEL0801]|nr:Plasma membrane t-SNARE, secretory vesicle fusion [Globomyces sp. JEL0801]
MSGRNRLAELGVRTFDLIHQINQGTAYRSLPTSNTVKQRQEFGTTITNLLNTIHQIDDNITIISKLHEKVLVEISSTEAARYSDEVNQMSEETKDLMNQVRSSLNYIVQETCRNGGDQFESRKAQQNNVIMKLQDCANRFGKMQQNAKSQYKRRVEPRPDASDADIQRAVEDHSGGSVFAQQMLNSRINAQKKTLHDVQSRHLEMHKLEKSIEELATLYQEMQTMLNMQQEVINTIDVHIDEANVNVERGGEVITETIVIAKAYRRKMWYISMFIAFIVIIVILLIYLQTQKSEPPK